LTPFFPFTLTPARPSPIGTCDFFSRGNSFPSSSSRWSPPLPFLSSLRTEIPSFPAFFTLVRHQRLFYLRDLLCFNLSSTRHSSFPLRRDADAQFRLRMRSSLCLRFPNPRLWGQLFFLFQSIWMFDRTHLPIPPMIGVGFRTVFSLFLTCSIGATSHFDVVRFVSFSRLRVSGYSVSLLGPLPSPLPMGKSVASSRFACICISFPSLSAASWRCEKIVVLFLLTFYQPPSFVLDWLPFPSLRNCPQVSHTDCPASHVLGHFP